MNLKTTISLVVLLVLAVAALLLTRGDETPTNGTRTPSTQTGDADAGPVISRDALGADLNRITFDGGLQGTMLQLERIDGRWWVTSPHRFAAKTNAVDDLLTQLSAMEGRPALEDERGGLVPDSSGLQLQYGDKEVALYFSGRLGAGRAVITVMQDDAFEDINTTDVLLDLFDTLDPDTFYSDRFDPPLMPEVGRIEFTTPEGQSALVQDKGRWWIEHAEGLERALELGLADYTGINHFFNLFQAAELIEKQTHYPTNGMASFGLEKPLISVRFVPIGEDPSEPTNGYEIHIGTPADPNDQTRYISNGYAGKATHPVFTIDTKIALAFAQDAKTFRDPRIVTTSIALIESVDCKSPDGSDQTIELKAGQAPTLSTTAGPSRPLQASALAQALRRLSDARALDYLPLQPAKWDGLMSVVVHPKLGGDPERLTIYTDPQNNADQPTVLVRRGDEPVALRVPRASVEGLLNPESLVTPSR